MPRKICDQINYVRTTGNGVAGEASQQGSETLAATTAHTQMALRMLADGKEGQIQMTENLAMDITAYKLSQHLGDDSIFAGYVAGNYDSSGDYWKLMDDGSLIWDGEKNLLNERGEVIRLDKTGSYSLSLFNWLGKDNVSEILDSHGIDSSNMSDSDMAEALFDLKDATWDSSAISPATGNKTGAWTDGQGNTELSSILNFQLPQNYAFHLGKISQESPDIGYWVGENQQVNAMKATGCYYISTLGAVQTQAGKLLTAEDINSITLYALDKEWLAVDDVSIWPTGAASREKISRVAFEHLGLKGYSLNFSSPDVPVGKINVGKTVNGNNHASEWGMNGLLFDPYQGIDYLESTTASLYYSVVAPWMDVKLK